METEVVVVGAGPTGLMLAGELRLAGMDVIVLERLEKPTGQSRGLGFTARAVEVFDQRGLLPWFGDIEVNPIGHFGGLPLDYSVLEDCHFGARGVPQSRTEQVLEEWATDLGADIRRGWELTDFTETADTVVVEVNSPAGRRELRAEYLVGCDGGRSVVRGLAGIAFPGTPATREMYLADVVGCEIRPRFTGERVPGGMVMSAPLEPGVDRVIVCERGAEPGERTEPIEFAEVAAAWRRLTGEDISGGEALWVSAFTDATHLADEYRRGRVLLAGDAAHTHLPAGGQGLSVGVQDAANLGWKLAATVRGRAPEGLLDSYHTERHAAGARLLTNTRAQGLLYLSGDEVRPMRELLAELMEFDVVRRHLAGMTSGFDVRYDMGAGTHPLPGARMPNLELVVGAGRTTVAELLRGGQGLLLDLAESAEARRVAAGWHDRVDVIRAKPAEPLAGLESVLIRPDGHVAWAAPDEADLGTSLSRWFGAPIS
ncbi:FAD-dependent monooxygenase [Amycolatopsis umgeniensis]|uniref:Bifunctional hydroxylase/dehydrase n=1 Tax=Amycolatopsis umgeniensis TaxID=336628 RepID=A0A841BG00_9PSEU|nr:FAD-dependent monooxygenase [Amycolatopsis umgeniensis]MBB5857492.1 bifunctional hydroxylase/dehydrase [Amycolatopsis umgeniensis]